MIDKNLNKLEKLFIEETKIDFFDSVFAFQDEEDCLYDNYESLMQLGGWLLWWAVERNLSTIGFINLINELAGILETEKVDSFFSARSRLFDECNNWLVGKA